MNLLMCAPLRDEEGNIRYFLGAQLDVSALVDQSTDLESFRRLCEKQERRRSSIAKEGVEEKDEFQQLSEMFNVHELETVRKLGGRRRIGRPEEDLFSEVGHRSAQENMWIHSPPAPPDINQRYHLLDQPSGKLSGFYQNVSVSYGSYRRNSSLITLVLSCSALSFPQHPFRFPLANDAWHLTISSYEQNRKQLPSPRRLDSCV